MVMDGDITNPIWTQEPGSEQPVRVYPTPVSSELISGEALEKVLIDVETQMRAGVIPWPRWQIPPEVTTAIGSARVVGNRVEFVLFDDPVGYTPNFKGRRWTKRAKKYIEYKEYVQGVVREIEQKFGVEIAVGQFNRPVYIRTAAFFRNGIHPDPENVHKGIKDALWWKPKGDRGLGDKYTGGTYEPPMYDDDNPRVHVEVWW